MNSEERTICLQNRIDMYALLARIFHREADETLLGALSAGKLPTDTGDERMDEGWRLIAAFVNRRDAEPKKIEDLAVDYAHTFLGAGFTSPDAAYPIESVYTSPGRLVMQDAWEAVCKAYDAAGLARRADDDLHEDHIALELEFMAELGRRALRAQTAGDEAEVRRQLDEARAFLEAHPLRWVKAFAADVERVSETTFYQGAAKLLNAFIASDLDFLKEA